MATESAAGSASTRAAKPAAASATTLAAARREAARLERENARLRRDLELVGKAIKMEATRRGWCSDYERVINRINEKLLVPLPADRFITQIEYDLGVRLSIVGIPPGYQRMHMPEPHMVANQLHRAMAMSGVMPQLWANLGIDNGTGVLQLDEVVAIERLDDA